MLHPDPALIMLLPGIAGCGLGTADGSLYYVRNGLGGHVFFRLAAGFTWGCVNTPALVLLCWLSAVLDKQCLTRMEQQHVSLQSISSLKCCYQIIRLLPLPATDWVAA
jgi:hypothetical protein